MSAKGPSRASATMRSVASGAGTPQLASVTTLWPSEVSWTTPLPFGKKTHCEPLLPEKIVLASVSVALAAVKVPTKPDAQMLVCYQLAHEVKPKDAPQVIEYIERLGKEFAVTFATNACKKNVSLVSEPAFDKWARNNSSLMAAIALSSRQVA